MSLKKKASRSIAIALVGVSMITPLFNSVSAMEKGTSITNNVTSEYNGILETTDIDYNIPEEGTITYIKDTDIIKALKTEGIDTSEYDYLLRQRATGTTKIVWKKNGFDVYISKRVASMLMGAGGAAAGILVQVIPGIGQATATIIAGAIGGYLSSIPENGKIFRFRTTKVQTYPGVYENRYYLHSTAKQ